MSQAFYDGGVHLLLGSLQDIAFSIGTVELAFNRLYIIFLENAYITLWFQVSSHAFIIYKILVQVLLNKYKTKN